MGAFLLTSATPVWPAQCRWRSKIQRPRTSWRDAGLQPSWWQCLSAVCSTSQHPLENSEEKRMKSLFILNWGITGAVHPMAWFWFDINAQLTNRASSWELAELKQTIKHWTILPHINCKATQVQNIAFTHTTIYTINMNTKTLSTWSTSLTKLTSLHLFAVLRHVVWTDGTQEFDVIITVIFGHLLSAGFVWTLKHSGHMNSQDSRQLQLKSDILVVWFNIHISPFFCRGHSWATSCVSCGFGGASWDALDRSNNFQHHLKWEQIKCNWLTHF